MRSNTAVFIDTSAWIALAVVRDPFHDHAVAIWSEMSRSGARPFTSVPVIMETFTFLDRNTRRDVALGWKESLNDVTRLEVLECTRGDLEEAWSYFERKDLHKLSAVDASSFVLMGANGLRVAFAFDYHFAVAGFRCLS